MTTCLQKEATAHLTLLQKKPTTQKFITAAHAITDEMGGASSKHFGKWLEETVGSIKAHNRDIPDALGALRLHGNMLATTNYDDILLTDELTPVTWDDSDSFLGAIRNKELDKIIFLHGHWWRPKSVVLDWDSYDRIVRNEKYRENLAVVWKMTTWVYIGCGVNGLMDPDFGLLLERYGSRAKEAGHWDYCLVRKD